MKIALNSDGFYEWGGGIDFIKYILSILETKPEICIDILLPRNDIHSLIREKAFPFKSIFLRKIPLYLISNEPV